MAAACHNGSPNPKESTPMLPILPSTARVLSPAYILACLVSLAACGDDGTSDTSGTDGQCNDCPSGKTPGDCICQTGLNEFNCHNDSSCSAWCTAQTGLPHNYFNPYCASADITTSCTGWDPDEDVYYGSGVYSMDYGFVQQLLADTDPIIVCDEAVFAPLTSGGFELRNVSSRDLAYALGLRNGDVPLSINNMPLDDVYDVVDALHYLFYSQAETEYELDVYRNSQTITLHYELYFTF